MRARDGIQVKGPLATVFIGTCGNAATGPVREQGQGSQQIQARDEPVLKGT